MSRIGKLTDRKFRLGEITVGKQLGVGGFGVVHEAMIAGIDFKFAIKFLDPSPFNTDAAAARERFFQEAEILFKLRHPHIVAIYGVGEHEGRPYILMERFDGLDLQTAREQHGTPDPISVLPFIERIARALGYAHSKNVIHRDIKPRNLMTIKGDGRVLDFGIATVLDPDGIRLTRTGGSWVGDGFSAPEIAESPRIRDPRCDVYSLGACWFWLLTGRHPKGLGLEATLRSAVKIPSDYERVLLRCLNQADSRYTNMEELAEAVRALQIGTSPRVGSSNSPTDNDMLMLGVIASLCPTEGESTGFYSIEQMLKGAMSRLSTRNALQRLSRLKFVSIFNDTDGNGNIQSEFRLTQSGAEWVEDHEERITSLMNGAIPTEEATRKDSFVPDEDIPF